MRYPRLSRVLPISVRTELVDVQHEQVAQRFLARDRTHISIYTDGLLMTVKRQYHITTTSATTRISGPHGYKAWTMRTTVAITPAGRQSLLSIRTYPRWRVALPIIAAVILLGVLASVAGLLSVLIVPLVVFTSLLYAVTVAATNVEAIALANLVRRVACDDMANPGAAVIAEPIETPESSIARRKFTNSFLNHEGHEGHE